MPVNRRRFLVTTGLSLAAGPALAVRTTEPPPPKAITPPTSAAAGDWSWVRDQFEASREWLHFASFFIVSHPRPVREAIETLRREIDANPAAVIEHGLFTKPDEVRASAAEYLGGKSDEVALTRSTTEGLALVYSGLRIGPAQEILTTTHDHYSHHESIRLAARRVGASVRKVALYDDSARASAGEMASRLRGAIRPTTRAVGITWVHSNTGVKLPLRLLADVVAEANRGREASDRILLIVDGVHGFGVEDETIAQTGCHFFVAGTHKWIFGPRGTGIVWGTKEAWAELQPTVPAFELAPYEAWLAGKEPGPTQAAWVSPGGFHAYEHTWALPSAFVFHKRIGRARIAHRIHELNGRIKDGLSGLRRVRLHTPKASDLSAGLVCFEVEGLAPEAVVAKLLEKRVIASASPYMPSYARLAGSLLNTPEEVDIAVRAVGALA